MDRWSRRVAVVGSRSFQNYAQLSKVLKYLITSSDLIISGGAIGADSMAQRWAKENGYPILVIYPNWRDGSGAGYARNKIIAEEADMIIAFYAKGKFQQGGTASTVEWARKLGFTDNDIYEIEESDVL